MKKIIYGLLIFIIACCVPIFGCDSRYGNLSMSAGISFSKTDENTTLLDNGAYRVANDTGVFDVNPNGTYTFYISPTTKSSAYLDVNFFGAPSDFVYLAELNFQTGIVDNDSSIIPTQNGFRTLITASRKGQETITVQSSEGNKKATIKINVVEVADSIEFANKDKLALTTEITNLNDLEHSNYIDLTNAIALNSSMTKITYEFGKLNGSNFTTYTPSELKTNCSLSVIGNILYVSGANAKDVDIKATYENPIGEDRVAYSHVKVVKKVSNLQVFYGNSKADAVEENKINDTVKLVSNIKELKTVDVVLKVLSMGEEVDFGWLASDGISVDVQSSYSRESVIVDGNYTYTFLTLRANKPTLESEGFENGEYTLQFACNYKKYIVKNYPITSGVQVKNVNYITQFSMNNELLPCVALTDPNFTLEQCEVQEVYKTTLSSYNGTALKFDIADSGVLDDDSKFVFKLYNAGAEEVTNFTDYLAISYKNENAGGVTPLASFGNEFKRSTFENGVTLYIKPTTTAPIRDDVQYFLVVEAENPRDIELKAVGTVGIKIVQGVNSVSSYDYQYYTVQDGVKQLSDEVLDVQFVDGEGEDKLNINRNSLQGAYVTINTIPANASFKNINVRSSDETIFKVQKDENSVEKFKLKITPVGLGSASIIIDGETLSASYKINVNVYNPIDNFEISLKKATSDAGVGDCLPVNGINIIRATVKVDTPVELKLGILPQSATQYTTKYEFSRDDGQWTAEYFVDANGVAEGSHLINDGHGFVFDCVSNTVYFDGETSTQATYTLKVTLTNLNGDTFVKEVALNAYIPVVKLEAELSNDTVYLPKTLSAYKKVNYEGSNLKLDNNLVPTNDASVFGVKVKSFAQNKRYTPTYSFGLAGKMQVIANGEVIDEYVAVDNGNGEFTFTRSSNFGGTSVLAPLSLAVVDIHHGGGAFHYFKLNENYTHFDELGGSVQIYFTVYDLGKNTLEQSCEKTLYIKSAEAVKQLNSSTKNTYGQIKQGAEDAYSVGLSISNENAFNKNLLAKVVNVIKLGETYYYVNTTQDNAVVNAKIENGQNDLSFNLTVSSLRAGEVYVIVMPEDKIITGLDRLSWEDKVEFNYGDGYTIGNITYKQVAVTQAEFESYVGCFYTKSTDYQLATTYNRTATYYIQTVDMEKIANLWKNYFGFNFFVTDGVKVPYQVATKEDLYDICSTPDLSEKRYVLTNDIYLSGVHSPLQNYYKASGISATDLSSKMYYALEDGNFVLQTENFDEQKQYYAIGFNGELSGKFVLTNPKNTNYKEIVKNYGIYKLSTKNIISSALPEYFGLFSVLGKDANIHDLTLSCVSVQTTVNKPFGDSALIFGAVAGVNYGTIENVGVSFQDFSISSSAKLQFGGLVAVNYGLVKNADLITRIKGSIQLNLKDASLRYDIGGIVGLNEVGGNVEGMFDNSKPAQYMFNDMGYNSTLSIAVNINGSKYERTYIGGAVGYNNGFVKNVVIDGEIKAPYCDNVGGLCGIIATSCGDGEYALKNSYSIAKITGHTYVGGAIGYVSGSADHKVRIFGVSAENYVSNDVSKRPLVISNNTSGNAGGLIGGAVYAEIEECYAVSYYDCISEIAGDKTSYLNYDIICLNEGGTIGGFIGNANETTFIKCASNVNVYSNGTASIFAGAEGGSAENSYAIGLVYAKSTAQSSLGVSDANSCYAVVREVVDGGEDVIHYSLNEVNSNEGVIKTYFTGSPWTVNENKNSGFPYLTTGDHAMFAFSPLLLNVEVKESDFIRFIKYDDDSVVVFFNEQELNNYPAGEIADLNNIKLEDILSFEVIEKTYKTAHIKVALDRESSLLTITDDGKIKLNRAGGYVTLTISSRINPEVFKSVQIQVANGLNNVQLYINKIKNSRLNTANLSVYRGQSQSLYVDTKYTRDITSGVANLVPNKQVGIRFRIENDANLEEVLSNIDDGLVGSTTTYGLNDLFVINSNWEFKGTYYYVDVPYNFDPTIIAKLAMKNDARLNISYVPYIVVGEEKLLLTNFAGAFSLTIIKGATDISFERNLALEDSTAKVEIDQLQNYVFTVTIQTDDENDAIINNFNEITDENFSIVASSPIVHRENGVIKSISVTYTVMYLDRENAIEEENGKLYSLRFMALSTGIEINLDLTIMGHSSTDILDGKFYFSSAYYPQQPSVNNVVYNSYANSNNKALFALQVYPYVAKFGKIKVSYSTDSSYPINIMQVDYNNNFANFENSGALQVESDTLLVEKTSGVGTYVIESSTGVYSYSKSYFFGIIVPSAVPSDTKYTINIQVLDYDGNVIATQTFDFFTMAQPMVSLDFSEEVKGNNGAYYLPYNTENELFVTRINYEGHIDWEVKAYNDLECTSAYELNANEEEVLLPYEKNNKNYVKIMKYKANSSDNLTSTNLIGKTIKLSAKIDIGQNEPYVYSVKYVISLFTVTGVEVQGLNNNILTIPTFTTTPLQAKINVVYDTSVDSESNNWYSNWYNNYKDKPNDTLKQYLLASGYELSPYFTDYISQLETAIVKADYNYQNTGMPLKKYSGVWFYNNWQLDSGKTYGEEDGEDIFGVELYNGSFIAIYGKLVDQDCNMTLRVNLAYTLNKGNSAVNGIPNVYNYTIDDRSENTYKTVKTFSHDFIMNFTYKTDLINAVPVSSEEEFYEMATATEGNNFRLVQDIVLTKHLPFDVNFSSFDGNGHTIYITGFGNNTDSEEVVNLSLFNNISSYSLLYNVKVYYTSLVEEIAGKLTPRLDALNVNTGLAKSVTFAGLVMQNNGAITNGFVTGKISIPSNLATQQAVVGARNAGLVLANNGYITNSKVDDFTLNCFGATGGFVYSNTGKIVASYFNNSNIALSSTANMGGFVYENKGTINECFVQGRRSDSDDENQSVGNGLNDSKASVIQNTGNGLKAVNGNIGGFAYQNIESGTIDDCYANIRLSSFNNTAGFVFEDSVRSVISRCYSICYNDESDSNATAMPFMGATASEASRIAVVNGLLVNCYFLEGNFSDAGFESNAENKYAEMLQQGDFKTPNKFTNYDLSLKTQAGSYADGTDFTFVDGSTWVIMEGKPLLASTLVDTVSQQIYEGKKKEYSEEFVYFDTNNYKITKSSPIELYDAQGTLSKRTVKYFNNPTQQSIEILTDNDLVYTTIFDNKAKTLQYIFEERGDYKKMEIFFVGVEFGSQGGKEIIKEQTLSSAVYDGVKVLDVVNEPKYTDNNFRANDTISLEKDETTGFITKIMYRVLGNASYYYQANALHVSDVVGTRTNPQIIYDEDSFSYYFSPAQLQNSRSRFFRIVRDIDFDALSTLNSSYASFGGIIQGNHMRLYNLTLTYTPGTQGETKKDSFGVFGELKNLEESPAYETIDTIISNLTIGVKAVESSAHNYVGALAGKVVGASVGTDQKVSINSVTVESADELIGFVVGKNAVGGLIGLATGNVLIKDVTTSVTVNATLENISPENLFYLENESNKTTTSYAGGVVGIFDVTSVEDSATLKNYNANNITVKGRNTFIGSIVGSAFGLVGKNAVVNYTNVKVEDNQASYVKALMYGGGFVGENRGTIFSSSVMYANEDNVPQDINVSSHTDYNYFYDGKGLNSIVAVGGFVGFNNGGNILQSITTIDVRNKIATLVGGFAGRVCGGLFQNDIQTGAVFGNDIVGGFVGSVNDKAILKYSGKYPEEILPEDELTTFVSCVGATNWLTGDYHALREVIYNQNAVGGFIGLIAKRADTLDENVLAFNERSFYSSALFSTTGGAPMFYLKPAYTSINLDTYTIREENANDALVYMNGDEQVLYPYTTREFYYEASADSPVTNPYYSYSSSWQVPNYSNDDPHAERYFILSNLSTDNIMKNATMFEKIDVLVAGDPWTTAKVDRTYAKYIKQFGKIYYFDGDTNSFVEVDEAKFGELEESDLYYMKTDRGTKFEVTKSYSTRFLEANAPNDLRFIGGDVGGKKDEITYLDLEEFEKQEALYLNGLLITLPAVELVSSNDETGEYEYKYSNVAGKLANLQGEVDTIVVKFIRYTNDLDDETYYSVQKVDVTYVYTDDADGDLVNLKATERISANDYTLYISSKKVIYNAFDNGYFDIGTNFYATKATDAQMYPVNKEFSNPYIWDNDEFILEPEVDSDGNILITCAEELAYIAHQVNNGFNSFEGATIKLTNDIDLSGKYWVPIGTEENPFMGAFYGQNGEKVYKIKYASVNENSNDGELPTYAGVFGYTDGASFFNVELIGGDIKGVYAGGLVGYAYGENGNPKSFDGIINKNKVTGLVYAGGIAGKTDLINVFNTKNYGKISLTDEFTDETSLYVGGLVGYMENGWLGNPSADAHSVNENYGKINVINNQTNYGGQLENQHKVSLYVGGLVGFASNGAMFEMFVDTNINQVSGTISVSTNAHGVYVGGVAGGADVVLSYVTNFGNMFVTINNSYSLGGDVAKAFVGGVVGLTTQSAILVNNEGDIEFAVETASKGYMAVGGVAGSLRAYGTRELNVERSYNSSNINVQSVNLGTTVNVGGIAGLVNLAKNNNFDSSHLACVRIENCYTTGNILVGNSSKEFVGGIVGTTCTINGNNYVFDNGYYDLAISKAINLAYVNIMNIRLDTTALGAIIGAKNDYVTLEDTFYLRDSAYSGARLFSAYSYFSIDENRYEQGEDEENKCEAKLASTLKTKETFAIRDEDGELLGYQLDFDSSWLQKYDTWFFSLQENNSYAMWQDETEMLASVKGAYLIENAKQLAYLARQINDGVISSKNITFKLNGYIDLSNKYWMPIGTKEHPFMGTFDGNGYVVRGLTIDGSIEGYTGINYGGLFGYVQDATIINVGIESPIIENVDYAGGLAYKVTNSRVEKIYTDIGDSVNAVVSGNKGAGGLIYSMEYCAQLESNNSNGGLYSSYNGVPVVATVNGERNIVGGLVATMKNCFIANCYNNYGGDVTSPNQIVTTEPEQNGFMVVGKVENDANDDRYGLDNVFNLALYAGYGSNKYECAPSTYVVNGSSAVVCTKVDPIFNNLEGLDVSAIWTSEYSLNPNGTAYRNGKTAKAYPSLRGLGQEWKNTESEALVSFNSKPAVEARVKQMIGARLIPNTLLCFYNDNDMSGPITYYLVTSAEELSWISTNVNNGSLITNNCEFILLCDIDLTGKYWTPIGISSLYPFMGTFNFNGHVISGLTIDCLNLSYVGLFGYTKKANIVNGYIDDAFIKVSSESALKDVYVGSFVGFTDNTSMKNLSFNGNIVGYAKASVFLGGIVGSMKGTRDYVISNVRVTSPSTSHIGIPENFADAVCEEGSAFKESEISVNLGGFSDNGFVYVGGVVGYFSGYGEDDTPNIYLIEYASCSSNIVGVSHATNVYVGGVVAYGLNSLSINASEYHGKAKSYSTRFDAIGGIAGYLNGVVANSFLGADGYLESRQNNSRSGEQSVWSYVGGIVGIQEDGVIRFCVSLGSTALSTISDDISVGGIIGWAKDRVTTDDKTCFYDDAGNNGFTGELGTGVPDDDTYAHLFHAFGSATITEEDFVKTYWDIGQKLVLEGKRIYLVGTGDESFAVEATADEAEKQLLNSYEFVKTLGSRTLAYRLGEHAVGDKLGIAFVRTKTENGRTVKEYVYREIDPLSTTGINLENLLSAEDVDTNNIIFCTVTLLRSTTE